ncbi:hypothetical protein PROPHIGD91-4_37 [Mycobacterium phage prophi91-4]|nr:hypothetical protein PROPHIGD91-4_37 [Mycobacterium phage prophi91-4]
MIIPHGSGFMWVPDIELRTVGASLIVCGRYYWKDHES